MSTSCQNLFDDAPSSVGKVFKNVLTIVREHWKPLILINLLNVVSLIGVYIVLGIFAAVVFAQMIADIKSATSDMQSSDMGNGRHLVNYMVGSGTTRALDYMNDNAYDNQNQTSGFDFDAFSKFSDIIMTYIGQIVVSLIIIITVVSLVTSTFVGAMTHAAAEAYSGDTPEACKSIRFGWYHKWQIYIYQILVLFLVFAVFMCPFLLFIASDSSWFGFVLTMLAAIAFITFFVTVMVAAIPAIIVEGKSSTAAIRRSYDLCKEEFCFICCNNFCTTFLYIVLMIVMDKILSIFPAVIAILLHLGINILTSIMLSMLPFVLYMSIRIRNENYTREDLCKELNTPIVKVTELGTFKRADIV